MLVQETIKKGVITPELEHRKSGYVERKRRPYQGNVVRACLKTFDKNGGVGDNRKKQAGAGENASIPK